MLDNAALQHLVEQQIQKEVAEKIQQLMTETWLAQIESNAVGFVQDRIVAKFANSEALPELISAVKTAVRELFSGNQLPGLGQYIDYDLIKQNVNDSTQEMIKQAINELSVDPAWLAKIEQLINQQAAQRVLASLSKVDIRPIIKESVSDAVDALKVQVFKGIQNQSESVELTVLDQHVVVEHNFTAKDIVAVDSVTVNNLVVKGSINTDNQSWDALSAQISKKTFEQLDEQWKDTLAEYVAKNIEEHGINFDSVKVGGDFLVKDGKLSPGITESNLRSIGALQTLTVTGDTFLNETVSVNKKRMGINTMDPDMALSVWDEEVAISAGKFKSQVGFIGTTRKQGLAIGVNKIPAIEIDDAGLTAVKKIQIGLHKISHGNEVPNYSGTKGDVVFNADPTIENPVFAWQCLGGFKWKVIKAVA